MPQLPMALDISPKEEIYFKGPYNRPITQYMYLQNPTESRIAFKVKTTAPTRYQVKPVTGIIGPNDHQKVTIVLMPLLDKDGQNQGPFDQTKQKFMVEAAVASENANAVQKILNLAKSKGESMESRLRCVFHEASLDNFVASQADSSNHKMSSSTAPNKSEVRSIITDAPNGPNGMVNSQVDAGAVNERTMMFIYAMVVLLVVYLYSQFK